MMCYKRNIKRLKKKFEKFLPKANIYIFKKKKLKNLQEDETSVIITTPNLLKCIFFSLF